MQLRKLHFCILTDLIKPSVRFSFFCVFFASKDNFLDFSSYIFVTAGAIIAGVLGSAAAIALVTGALYLVVKSKK